MPNLDHSSSAESTGCVSVAGAPANAASFKLGYRPVLDGLRGISIVAVMVVHGGLFWLGRGGFLGVDIFFVLSGFLITALLLDEYSRTGTIGFGNFYMRRALRLLPALVAVIACCAVAVLLFPPAAGKAQAIRSILIALFYLSNWTPGTVYGPLFHTWSLGIEEQFYLIWPLLLFVIILLKPGHRWLLLFLLFAITIIAINRALLWESLSADQAKQFTVYTRLDARSDSLLVGCIAGVLISRNLIPRKEWFNRALKLAAAISAIILAALLIGAPSNARGLYFGGFTAIALMVALIILNLFTAPIQLATFVLELSALRWLGRISYGLYLWHLPVYRLYDAVIPPLPVKSYTVGLVVPFIIKVLVSVGVAAISFYVIEQPILQFKRRFSAGSPPQSERFTPIVMANEPQSVSDLS